MLPCHLLVEVLDYHVPVSSRSILCKHGHQPDTAVTPFLLSLDITFWLPGRYWLEIAVGGSLDKVTSCYSVMSYQTLYLSYPSTSIYLKEEVTSIFLIKQ